jgi:hypothetical protein
LVEQEVVAPIEYFSQFPTILYSFDTANNDFRSVVNILDRAVVIPQVLAQGYVFYPYSYKDQDKPETVAFKYYGDTKRHWMVMYANQIIDPWNDFPLSLNDFNNNIISAYGSMANAAANLHHVEMQTTTLTISPFGQANSQTVVTILASPYVYNFKTGQVQNLTLPNIATPTITVGSNTTVTHDGSTVTISQVMVAVSALTYLQQQNETKRIVQLLDKQYAPVMEKQLSDLLSQ